MKRCQIAPGAFITTIPGEKFKRCKISIHLVLPGQRENATDLALLPHVLDRRYADVPDPTQLSRLLYALYGAGITSESYTAGPFRVVTLGISGLKNEFALSGEDLTQKYMEILTGMLFRPVLESGVFAAEDVSIEKEKQTDFLLSEMNDKRSYCLRQARRKLYGNSPLGIESPGYLEDMEGVSPVTLHQAWQTLLETAQIEILVCGAEQDTVSRPFLQQLEGIQRRPVSSMDVSVLENADTFSRYEEPMQTTQGKLCLMYTSGVRDEGRGEIVMRMASALLGGLPTSRLFANVREKQSLCYYCASSYGYFSGTVVIDSGIDHKNALLASRAIQKELAMMQESPVSAEELDNAKRYMYSVFSASQDSPDALMNFAFTEWLKGTNRTLEQTIELCNSVSADEIQQALARFRPAVEYVITEKGGQ